MATPELGHRMYGYTLLDCIVESQECSNCKVERERERERARGTGTSVTFSGTLVTIKGHFSNMQGTLVTCRHFGNSVRAL